LGVQTVVQARAGAPASHFQGMLSVTFGGTILQCEPGQAGGSLLASGLVPTHHRLTRDGSPVDVAADRLPK